MQVVKNGKTLNVVVKRITKSKIYLRAKEEFVLVTCTKKTTIKHIEELVLKHFDFLYSEMQKKKTQDVIHYNGIAYKPRFFVGKSNAVMINGDEIWICAKNNNKDEYKKALHEFYKNELINEFNKLIDQAKIDFYEVKRFPTFEFKYLKSVYGNYSSGRHHIKLSTILVKFDFKYIKYVLYHELSHILECNHSSRFYKVFVAKYPKAIEVKKEMNKIKYYDYI